MATQAELAEIQKRYRVRARNWLDLEIEYEGRGEAEFSSNPGTLRGPMTIQYDEDGTAGAFAMTVDELIAEHQPFGPDELFVFVNALPLPGGDGYGFGGSSNKCTRVELTGDGVVVATAQRSDVMASAGNQKATFRPYRTIARFETAAQPRYWAVPLLNFTSGFFIAVKSCTITRFALERRAVTSPGRRTRAGLYRASARLLSATTPR